ncbi:hypothetical protein LOTGIDRAFT_231750 [Lottia gigantea]|uniref:Tudor domain-containing protein n=1 Tax=Lottia gigantea TaxID=225164 RepID=V3ZZM0_LOTGI|nr:hypothetical protein LOTGIDRAFT_231750 [Lottia gigantea]ESO96998.1 hypothetical protein LOTGIDRAFT_231750 [Lottia gigantea]
MAETGGMELFQGRVTHVIDPFNFWAQVGTEQDIESFRWLQEELYKFCEGIGCIRITGRLENIDSGCCVLVKHNGNWYRAQVARIDSDKRKLDIVYVDYGDSDMVSIDQVCLACPIIFTMLKPQASKCRLAGITPLAKNWTSRGINYFKEITKGKIFQTAIVRINNQFMYDEVSLYTSDKEGRSLAHILMQEEIGIANDEEVPEFSRDVKSRMPESYLENFSYDTDDLLTSDYTNSPVGFDQSDGRESVQSTNQQSFNINLYNMSDSSNNRSDNNSPHNQSNSSNRRLYNESPYEMTNIINSRYYGNNQQAINTTYTTGFYSDSDSSSVTSHKQHNKANQMSGCKQSSGLSNQNASQKYGKESRRLYMADNASNSTEPLSGLSTPLNYSTDFGSGDENFNSKNSFQSIYSNSWSTAAPIAKQDSSDQSNNFWSNFPSEDQVKTALPSIWSYNYTATNGDHINNIWSTNDGSNIWSAVPTNIEDKPIPVEPPSPEILIPGFNLSTIMKTKSACPDEIQEVRDVERRVTTKTEVVDNMEQIYEELEKDESKDIINWGRSDLSIGTPDTSQPPDVYDNIKSQIESISPMNKAQYKLPPSDKKPTPPPTAQYSHQYTPHYPSRYQKPPPQKYTQPARFQQKENRSSQPNRSSPKLNSRQQILEAIILEDSFKPVVKLENSEEAEYRFSKKIEKVLKTIENEEDPVIVCDKIHSIVPPENDGCEANVLSVCLETILDRAVLDKQNTQKLLTILDSYSHCDIFGACMEYVIKKLSKAYLKLPVRKTYHTDYSIVLVKLLQLSNYWPDSVSGSIQELILSTVERWIIFNKKGLQGGPEIQSLSELYIDCLESVWLLVSEVLSDEYPDKYQYYIEQIEEKFLADGLRSAYRAKLFGIYKSSLVHQQINLKLSSQSKPATDSVCYVDTPVLKSEMMTQTDRLELESRGVQTEDNADDIQVPDEWWLRDSVTSEQQYQGDESFSKNTDSQDLNQSCDTSMEQRNSNLERISSFSEIYRLEELRHSRSNSPLATRSNTSQETNQSMEQLKSPKSGRQGIESPVATRDNEAPYKKENKDALNEHESKMAVHHNPDQEYDDQDLPTREEESAESVTFDPHVLNGKHPKEDHSKSADLFTPLFKKKSSASKKSKSKYGSWADCVKKDNVEPDSGSLHSDHLKHLAIQTLKSGVLKGKNVQARRQLSSEELKVLVKPAADGLTEESISSPSTEVHHQPNSSSRTLSSLIDQSPKPAMQPSSTPSKPVSELKFVPYGNKTKDRSMPQGKFLPPKRVPTNLTTTKGHPLTPKPSTKPVPLKPSKIIHGRDLPEQAKLTRRQMEERAEMEAMRKFPPKIALQQTNRPDNQSNKYRRPTDVSEWPSLNSDKDSKAPKKISKSSSNNTSLHSIATDILMAENKPSRVSDQNLSFQKQTVGFNSSDSSRADKPNGPKGDNSETTNVECKSSHYDNSDEWESDFSDDDIMVTGATDCKPASPPLAQQVSPPKTPTYQFRPTRQDYGWSPKTRTCTNCGETTHVVYDCPRKSSILF